MSYALLCLLCCGDARISSEASDFRPPAVAPRPRLTERERIAKYCETFLNVSEQELEAGLKEKPFAFAKYVGIKKPPGFWARLWGSAPQIEPVLEAEKRCYFVRREQFKQLKLITSWVGDRFELQRETEGEFDVYELILMSTQLVG
jgi:hypothetical protein